MSLKTAKFHWYFLAIFLKKSRAHQNRRHLQDTTYKKRIIFFLLTTEKSRGWLRFWRFLDQNHRSDATYFLKKLRTNEKTNKRTKKRMNERKSHRPGRRYRRWCLRSSWVSQNELGSILFASANNFNQSQDRTWWWARHTHIFGRTISFL